MICSSCRDGDHEDCDGTVVFVYKDNPEREQCECACREQQ